MLFILNSYPRVDRFLLSGQNSGPASVVALSPDGHTLALAIKVDDTHYQIALWRQTVPGAAPEKIVFEDTEDSPGPIYGLAFSPNSKVLASVGGLVQDDGSFRSQVILWDVREGRNPVKLAEPSDPDSDPAEVLTVAFSPDGKRLATAGKDGRSSPGAGRAPGIIRLWDVSRPERPRLVGKSDRGPKEPGPSADRMLGLAFSRDGKTLVAGGGAGDRKSEVGDHLDGEIAVWDVDTFPERVRRLPLSYDEKVARSYAVCGLAFDQSDGGGRLSLLAVGCLDGSVALIELDDKDPKPDFFPESSLSRHRGFVRSLACSGDGRWLATGGSDTAIILWDISNPKSPRPIDRPMQGHHGDIQSLMFEGGDAYLRSAARDETWVRWNVATPNGLARHLPEEDGPAHAAAFQPGGTLLATARDHHGPGGNAAADSAIRLWDISGKEFRQVGSLAGHLGRVLDIAFSPDGDLLATGGADGQVLLWDIRQVGAIREGRATPAPVKDAQGRGAHGARINRLRFRPAAAGPGRVLASASDDSTVKLWDVSEPRAPRLLSASSRSSRYPVLDLVFSPDGRTLATAHWEKGIQLWDVADPENTRMIGGPLIGHEDAVLCLAFSPDGRWLASGGKDNMILLWDREAGGSPAGWKLFHEIQFHRRPVWSVAFSPDGEWLASASEDEGANLHLWNTHELSKRHSVGPQLNGHVGRIHRVASFDLPSGSPRLVSAGQDGAVLIWDYRPRSGSNTPGRWPTAN